MATTTRTMTAEELWELPETPGVRHELVRGEMVEMPGAGGIHGAIANILQTLLTLFVWEHKSGQVSGGDITYIIARDPDTLRIPDVSFVSRERIPPGGIPKGYWPLAPDFAVEIVSPNDRATDLHTKALDYLAAGVRLVWVVWPDTRSVTVYTPDDDRAREVREGGVLDGADVLPGFSVPVARLFAVEQ